MNDRLRVEFSHKRLLDNFVDMLSNESEGCYVIAWLRRGVKPVGVAPPLQ